MDIDLNALTTNAKKLDEYIDKNEKQERDRKDEQLYGIIERKVKKEEHKREKPRGQDGALKECKRLFKEGASPEVLTKLEESLREQEKYYRYYVQCFLPVLDKAIKRSKKISNETKERVKQVISEITDNSKYCSNSITHNKNDRRNSEDSEAESGYCSDIEDDHKVEISNEITNSNALLLKAIKNGNNRKFKKYLKDCTDINSVKGEKDNNILHLIVSLEKKQKCKFLGTLIKTVTEEDLAQLINSKNQEEQTPLHQLLQHIKEKNEDRSCTDRKFEKTNRYKALELFLQNGADITVQDKDGKNALHYIASFKGEQKVTCLELISNKDDAVNTTNREGLTPLHQLLQHIKGKNEDRSCTDRKFEKTKRYETLELLLKNGADITVQDKDEKNALHYIASFKGEQKVTCLELILGLVKNGTISKDKLGKAINAKNGEGNTPLELALKKKAEKRSIEYLPQGTIFDTATAYDNTTKFCTMLLEIGADPCSLELKDPKFHTKKYYLTLRDLKDYSGTPQKAQEKAKELKEKLEEKYHCKTASKKCKSGIKEAGSGIKKGVSAVAGFIDPAKRTRELLAITITITVIAMVTFAFFQGQMAIGAAIPIIAVAGVICLTLTLGFSGIKKLFEKSTNKAQDTFNDKNRSNSTTEQNQASKNLVNNDQQNLRNETKNQAVQESPNQPEHTENPATKMSDVSILRQFMNKLDGLTNKPSSLAL
ncbi:ankyrin repeat domain-containing protein [Wolbachia endosymbiont (group A) of Volucella inflata]|uniref:ankyrin repeat domain-containing protein n=1 Tax=Wolbachia endosymbiont (group A) of Volucella inflata TaxID=2954065 RepID=UPI00222638A8|nr:ankyrin repeat domain-containing protein [Wolbachia endosymbiont (group A) of Volucella inflata]